MSPVGSYPPPEIKPPVGRTRRFAPGLPRCMTGADRKRGHRCHTNPGQPCDTERRGREQHGRGDPDGARGSQTPASQPPFWNPRRHPMLGTHRPLSTTSDLKEFPEPTASENGNEIGVETGQRCAWIGNEMVPMARDSLHEAAEGTAGRNAENSLQSVNNGSENDIRCQVTRRKISGGTRSETGRDCRDAFLGLMKHASSIGPNLAHSIFSHDFASLVTCRGRRQAPPWRRRRGIVNRSPGCRSESPSRSTPWRPRRPSSVFPGRRCAC